MSTDASASPPSDFAQRLDAVIFKPKAERVRDRDLAMLNGICGSQRRREEERAHRERASWWYRLRDVLTLRGARVRELEHRVAWLEARVLFLWDERAAQAPANRADSNPVRAADVKVARSTSQPGWPPHYGHPVPLTNPWEKE